MTKCKKKRDILKTVTGGQPMQLRMLNDMLILEAMFPTELDSICGGRGL